MFFAHPGRPVRVALASNSFQEQQHKKQTPLTVSMFLCKQSNRALMDLLSLETFQDVMAHEPHEQLMWHGEVFVICVF